ncbi:MAG: Fic family protein [Planctomycetes bacterium]|nr:Fic family protein [Planctomycetota bacterium]
MKITELRDRSGLTIDWMHDFVRESNKIDPQPGYENEPGSPRFDSHLATLYWAVEKALGGTIASPSDCHESLMFAFLYDAGEYRTVGVRVGPYVKPAPHRIAGMMAEWAKRVESTILGLTRTGADPQPADDVKREALWGLHCEYENIHPWRDGNGRSGRLLMVNHAMLVGLEPWTIHFGDEQQAYYRRIEAHPSHAWGNGRMATQRERLV